MASILKLRRGNSVSHSGFTGAQGEVTFNTDTKELVAHDGITAGGFPSLGSKTLAAASGASLIGANAYQTQASVNAECLSVKSYPQTQTGFEAAVAAAYAAGAGLRWPAGLYVSTANIPNFHAVRHTGDGIIQRGSSLFYITPNADQTNTLYLVPGGSGDGLSATEGMGIGSIAGALRNVGEKAANGNWKVFFTAGTYTETGIQPTYLPTFSRGLTLEGAMDGATHLSAWDGTASSAKYAFRMDLVGLPQFVIIKNLKFINWVGDPSNAGAIVMWGNHNLTTQNVRIENCRIGIWVSRNSQHRSQGDYISGCSTFGIGCQYSSSVVVGLSTARTIIKNCTWGLHVGRVSVGHNDYADFEGNQYDLHVAQNSRITHLQPTFKTWSVASHYIQNGAINESMDVCTFDAASITDTTPVLLTQNSPIIDVVDCAGTEVLHTNFAPTAVFTLTGTTADTALSNQVGYGAWARFPKFLLYQGKGISLRFKARVQGSNTGVGATFRLAGQGSSEALDILTFDLPAGGYIGVIEADIEFCENGTAFAYGTLTTQSSVIFASKTMSVSTRDLLRDKTSAQTLWRVYAKLVNTTDTFTMFTQKSWVTV